MDDTTFKVNFAALCSAINYTSNPAQVKVYKNMLNDLSNEEFVNAIHTVIQTHRFTSLPTVATIREAARGNAEDNAINAKCAYTNKQPCLRYVLALECRAHDSLRGQSTPVF